METLMTSPAATTNEGASSTTLVTAEPAAAPAGQPAPSQATEAAPKSAEPSSSQPQAQGAPDKYDFKAPEGKAFDPQVLEAYSTVAKELNLPQEAAQKMLDRLAPVLADRQSQQIEEFRQQWADASKADKEFGGEKLAENLAVAKKALDRFGSPELVQLLNATGLGNNLHVIRAFLKAGQAISEDRFVKGSAPSAPRDPARVMFPTMS